MGCENCAFRSKNCCHYSKGLLVFCQSIKVIVYRCREQRLFCSLNTTSSVNCKLLDTVVTTLLALTAVISRLVILVVVDNYIKVTADAI